MSDRVRNWVLSAGVVFLLFWALFVGNFVVHVGKMGASEVVWGALNGVVCALLRKSLKHTMGVFVGTGLAMIVVGPSVFGGANLSESVVYWTLFTGLVVALGCGVAVVGRWVEVKLGIDAMGGSRGVKEGK